MHRLAFDPLPIGLVLLAFGLGVAAVTFLSLAEPDVTYARTQWTALLAMALATPAILLYVHGGRQGFAWWRAFWTTGFSAFLLHFWWAVFKSFDANLAAIIGRQGWVAYSNFLMTLLWGIDVAIACLWAGSDNRAIRGFRFIAWAAVTASFIAASAFFRSGAVAYLGYGLGAAVLTMLSVRTFGFGMARDEAADD